MNNFIQKFWRLLTQHALVAGFIVAGLVLVFGSLLLVLPRLRAVKELSGFDIVRLERSITLQKAYLADLNNLKNNLSQVSQDDLSRLESVVPRGRDIPAIFRQMEDFAKAVDMELTSVSVSDGGTTSTGAVGSTMKTQSISVVLNGNLGYNRLKAFLNELSTRAPILDLTSISYSESTSVVPSSYNFSFRSYYFE